MDDVKKNEKIIIIRARSVDECAREGNICWERYREIIDE
jgi:hypothetical protein